MIYKNTLISFISIMGIGFAAWLTLSHRSQDNLNTAYKELPDTLMEDVSTIIMNEQGRISMKITTPLLIHFSENDATQFTSPKLTLYRDSSSPWHITANFAYATKGMQQVELKDKVIIHHLADSENPSTLITTQILYIYPETRTAETSALITMQQPNLTIQATGMKANVDKGEVKLLSKARGIYAEHP